MSFTILADGIFLDVIIDFKASWIIGLTSQYKRGLHTIQRQGKSANASEKINTIQRRHSYIDTFTKNSIANLEGTAGLINRALATS